MTSPEANPTLFHVGFDEDSIQEFPNLAWLANLLAVFPEDRKPQIHITADMTHAEFTAMTDRDDVENHIAYLLEHSEGPGFYGLRYASIFGDLESFQEAIEAATRRYVPALEDLDAAAQQALLATMVQTLDFDWKINADVIDHQFLAQHEDKIKLFTTDTRPAWDDGDDGE